MLPKYTHPNLPKKWNLNECQKEIQLVFSESRLNEWNKRTKLKVTWVVGNSFQFRFHFETCFLLPQPPKLPSSLMVVLGGFLLCFCWQLDLQFPAVAEANSDYYSPLVLLPPPFVVSWRPSKPHAASAIPNTELVSAVAPPPAHLTFLGVWRPVAAVKVGLVKNAVPERK